MGKRTFDDVQGDLDNTLWNLKGTTDPEFKRGLLRKVSRLLEEAHRVLDSSHQAISSNKSIQ
ncbi:MAG TPA: hypothetical protein VIL63_09795 [Terriglobales bacterium]